MTSHGIAHPISGHTEPGRGYSSPRDTETRMGTGGNGKWQGICTSLVLLSTSMNAARAWFRDAEGGYGALLTRPRHLGGHDHPSHHGAECHKHPWRFNDSRFEERGVMGESRLKAYASNARTFKLVANLLSCLALLLFILSSAFSTGKESNGW